MKKEEESQEDRMRKTAGQNRQQTMRKGKGQRQGGFSHTHNHIKAGLEVCCYKAAGKSIKKIKWAEYRCTDGGIH